MHVLRTIAIVTVAAVALARMAVGAESLDPRIESAVTIYRQDGAEKALPRFEALAEEFRGTKRPRDHAAVLHYVGECHWRLGHFDQARDYLNRALTLERSSKDRLGEGKTLNTLGLLEWDQGNYDPAMARFRKAGAIARDIGDHKLEGSSLNNLSLVYDELGDYDTSLKQYHQVLDLYSGADFPRGVGDTLGNIGGVYLLLGQFKEALGYYQQALKISEQLKSKASMSQDHGNIALCLLGLGDIDGALVHLDHSIAFAKQTGMQQDQAYWTREKGNALVKKGQYDQALANHRAALDIYEKIGAQAELLETLHDSGRLHLLLGDYGSAERDFTRALNLATSIGFARGVTQNLIALGDIQAHRAQWDEAASFYDQARQRSTTAGQKQFLAESLLALANISYRQNWIDAADGYAKQALALAKAIDSREFEAEALIQRGEIALQRGRHKEALAAFDASGQSIAPIGDPDVLWRIEFGRGRALEAGRDIGSAITAFQAAIGVIESTRNRLQQPRFRAGYMEDKFDVYRALLRLQLKQGKTSEAFTTAERLRARAYVEQLGGRYSYALSDADRQKEGVLRARIRKLQDELAARDDEGNPEHPNRALSRFSQELLRAEREYQAFLDDHARADTKSRPEITDSMATAVQRNLASDAAVLEFIVGRKEVVAFVLTPHSVIAHTLSLDQAGLEARIALLRDLVRHPENQQWFKPAAKLYDQLIAPLESDGSLRNIRRLYIVPHGPLNYLSFAMLPSGESGSGRLLIDQFTIGYLPAAAALLNQSPIERTNGSLLALAPSRSHLRYAAEEARSVQALYLVNSRLLLGTEATESRFKEVSSQYRFLHLATHGYFDHVNPLLSGLELEGDASNDGLLQVHEVLGLHLRSSLVTLSACDTALGSGYFIDLPAGDEFIGLTRAFLSAGSAAVLAALWPVDDQASVTVMKRFYSELAKTASTTASATALAQAQRELRRHKELEHPFYWAAYVVVGPMGRDEDRSSQSAGRST